MANSCTTETCERVVALMKEGLTLEEVCAQIGVTRKTLYDWRDKKGPHYERGLTRLTSWERHIREVAPTIETVG